MQLHFQSTSAALCQNDLVQDNNIWKSQLSCEVLHFKKEVMQGDHPAIG